MDLQEKLEKMSPEEREAYENEPGVKLARSMARSLGLSKKEKAASSPTSKPTLAPSSELRDQLAKAAKTRAVYLDRIRKGLPVPNDIRQALEAQGSVAAQANEHAGAE
jgi:hypothetical protein